MPHPDCSEGAMVTHNPVVQSPKSLAATELAHTNIRRWSVVGLLFLGSLINYLDRATISMALPGISKEFALRPTTQGILLSAFFWSYSLMQVPIGWCADRYSMRWLFAGAFALWSFACGLTGVAGSLSVLIVLRVLLGVGESVLFPCGTKIVSIMFRPHERGLPSGLFLSGSRLGIAVGAPLIAWLILRHGWRTMFLLVGLPPLLWLIPWLAAYPRRLRSASAGPQRPAQPTSMARRRVLTFHRNLLGICLGIFCYDYYWFLLVTWLPNYLITVRHLSLLRAGFYASLPYLVFGVGLPVGGWIADSLIHWGWDETRTRKGMITLAFVTGLLLIPAMWAASETTALALIGGAALVGTAGANLSVITQSCAPEEEVGVWTGTANLMANIAGAIAPIVTGFLIGWTGSYRPAFVLAAVLLLAGVVAYWFIVGELNPPAQASSSVCSPTQVMPVVRG
jgi:ACS family D-galactonate transporter-like MFS transporter